MEVSTNLALEVFPDAVGNLFRTFENGIYFCVIRLPFFFVETEEGFFMAWGPISSLSEIKGRETEEEDPSTIRYNLDLELDKSCSFSPNLSSE